MVRKKRKRRTVRYKFKSNGKGKRESTAEARKRVLKVARRRGSITHKQARIIGRWDQAWYHLNAMRRAGLLKKDKFNVWRPR